MHAPASSQEQRTPHHAQHRHEGGNCATRHAVRSLIPSLGVGFQRAIVNLSMQEPGHCCLVIGKNSEPGKPGRAIISWSHDEFPHHVDLLIPDELLNAKNRTLKVAIPKTIGGENILELWFQATAPAADDWEHCRVPLPAEVPPLHL